MEHKAMIHVAAKEGDVKNLEAQINSIKKEEVKALVESMIDGTTPLLIATRNGHMDVVRFLIESCDVDVESTGSVAFDGYTIERAKPLSCAAAVGRLDIVKYLITKSAKINGNNGHNGIPLRVACIEGYIDIVKFLVEKNADIESANLNGNTCLMTSCCRGQTDIVKYLLSMGADVNRKDKTGQTALHYCAKSESGNQEIMKLLLQYKGKSEKDNEAITPLMAAANTGHVHLVEYLTKRDAIMEKERIDALELLGAALYVKKKDVSGAIGYWKQALQHKRSSLQHPVTKPDVWSWITKQGGVKALETEEELDMLKSDLDPVKIAMHCLLVRERILGVTHYATLAAIGSLAVIYFNKKNFDRWCELNMCGLEILMSKQERLSLATQKSLYGFAQFYKAMMDNNSTSSITIRDMCDVFSNAVTEIERGKEALMADSEPSAEDENRFSRLIMISLHLLSLICRLRDLVTPIPLEDYRFKNLVIKLINTDPRTSKGRTLLHLGVLKCTMNIGDKPVCTFPCIRCVQLLTSLGMPLNTVDEGGKTAYDLAYAVCNENPELLRQLRLF